MLIRIALIVAIIAGLAAGVLNFVQVKEKITTTIAERDKNAKDRDAERAEKQKAQKLAKDTQTTLDQTKTELASTKDERDKAVAEASDATKKAADLTARLQKTTQERDAAQNDLAAWKALGIPIDAIKQTLASIKDLKEQREVLEAEKKILAANNLKLQNKLNSLIDPEFLVKLPDGLKGKVLAVDPKYDFVVLDIGDKQGVLEDGQMLVNRNGKLIAKVKIKSVQANRSIANVLPGWKVSDLMEGDQVLY
jgi:vacuolar-type H+-ATPase subunit I/STV1